MKRSEIYKCADCGLTFEVTTGCSCPVSCCGKEMKLMQAQTADHMQEKHVPFPEAVNGGKSGRHEQGTGGHDGKSAER